MIWFTCCHRDCGSTIGLALDFAPFRFLGLTVCFQSPCFLVRLKIVDALWRWFPGENTGDLGVAPDHPVAGAIPGGVQELGDGSFAAVMQEQFICLTPNGGFFGMGNELLVLPLIAIRSAAIDGFAEFGADNDGCLHAVGNFFPFPLGHGGDHSEEQPASRRAGVDGLLQGDHVRIAIAELVGEIEKLSGVAGKLAASFWRR